MPFLARRQLLVGLAEIDDAALAEAGLGADAFIHSAPGFERYQNQRNLAYVAAHLPAPAPVAARLLAGDDAFLDERHVDAALGKLQRRRGADDAAADDGDCGPLRQFGVGIDRSGRDGHSGKIALRSQRAGMRLGILLEEMRGVHLGIDLGGRKRGMAQKFLDGAQIGAARQQMGGEGMAQGMGRRGVRAGRVRRAGAR